METALFLKQINIHTSWEPFLSDEIRELLLTIEAEIIKDTYTPEAGKVLRFMEVPLDSAKVLIIGQDPYPQPGVATGRAFEVGTLRTWNQPFMNVSLKNILRAVYRAYTGEIILFSRLKEKFNTEFPILSPYNLFEYWESQGVLLLNTSFTCEVGYPGSHKKYWDEFTNRLLFFISGLAPQITWFIWGNHAAEATKSLHLERSYFSQHPMMCSGSAGRNNDFLFGPRNCFKAFVNEIDWTGFAFKKKITQQGKLF